MPSLQDAHVFAKGHSPFIPPKAWVQSGSLDNEGVALPPADGISVKPGAGIFGHFPSIRPDFAPNPGPFKKLDDVSRCMNELKRSGVNQRAKKARHVRVTKRIVSCRGKAGSGSLSRLARFEFGLSFWREWELFLRPFTDWITVGPAAPLQPNSAQIMWIMRR